MTQSLPIDWTRNGSSCVTKLKLEIWEYAVMGSNLMGRDQNALLRLFKPRLSSSRVWGLRAPDETFTSGDLIPACPSRSCLGVNLGTRSDSTLRCLLLSHRAHGKLCICVIASDDCIACPSLFGVNFVIRKSP